MEIGIIVKILVLINVLLFAEANSFDEKNTNASIDSYETQKTRSKSIEHSRDSLRYPARKLAEMLSQSERVSIGYTINHEARDPIDEGNRKILKFGKRVIESIKRHGIQDNEARLLKSGKYRIDWWKKDRRLERIRKRLEEELERKPELKLRLLSLGWRNASEPIHRYKKIHSDHSIVKKPIRCNNELKNSLLYKTLITSLKSLRNSVTTTIKGTDAREPVIFVYMPITIESNPTEIKHLKEPTTEAPEIDSPTKFNLNTFSEEDFDAMVSNVGVIDVTSGEASKFRSDESSSTSNSSGQVFDSDRLLQLIPLIVEELRSGRMSDDERRAFGWIFGKRIWQLLESEASKSPGETMDQDLAMFLLKGELLGERDSENERRRRRQRRGTLRQPIVKENAKLKRDYDYDFEDENYDDQEEPIKEEDSSENFDDDKTQEASFIELIELAAKHQLKKFKEEKKMRDESKKPKKKWMDDSYDDYSYEDENNY